MTNSQDNPPEAEPLFIATSKTDAAFQNAYEQAAASLSKFIQLMQQQAGEALCSVKLRFRDPDESERLGEDRFAFIWLTAAQYHSDERLFSGTFFEVPCEFRKWHHAGQVLTFDPEDIFDWMVLREGHLQGGFTLRVSRAHLPEAEREAYDRHIGVSVYEPMPY